MFLVRVDLESNLNYPKDRGFRPWRAESTLRVLPPRDTKFFPYWSFALSKRGTKSRKPLFPKIHFYEHTETRYQSSTHIAVRATPTPQIWTACYILSNLVIKTMGYICLDETPLPNTTQHNPMLGLRLGLRLRDSHRLCAAFYTALLSILLDRRSTLLYSDTMGGQTPRDLDNVLMPCGVADSPNSARLEYSAV